MWAGYLALVNQQSVANGNKTVGFINPTLYSIGESSSYDSDFHDVTSGSNGFSATTGYDLATGWGSPNGSGLLNALAGSSTSPTPGFSLSASPGSVSIVQGNSGSSTITSTATGGFTGAVTLAASGAPAGVTITFNPSSIAGAGTSSMSIAVATSVATGTYTMTVTGTSGANKEATTVSLTVTAPKSSGEGPFGGTPAAIPGTVMAENYDTGGQGVGYNVTSINGTNNGYRSDGVDLEKATSPATGNNLGWTASGQWFRYTVNVATAGTYKVSFLVAGDVAVTDAFHLSNSSGTNLSGSVNVPSTGGWQAWTTVTATVTLPAGVQTLTLNEDNPGWNIDSIAFASTSGGEGPFGGTPAAIPGKVMAENYDTGGQGVAYNVTSVNGTDNSYRSDGVDLEAASAPATGNDLGWTAAGQWFKYTVNVATAGTYTVTFEVASPNGTTDAFHIATHREPTSLAPSTSLQRAVGRHGQPSRQRSHFRRGCRPSPSTRTTPDGTSTTLRSQSNKAILRIPLLSCAEHLRPRVGQTAAKRSARGGVRNTQSPDSREFGLCASICSRRVTDSIAPARWARARSWPFAWPDRGLSPGNRTRPAGGRSRPG
jgi:hypothetical protein